jgi:hypothetical protein
MNKWIALAIGIFLGSYGHGQTEASKLFAGSPKFDEVYKTTIKGQSLSEIVEGIATKTGLKLAMNAKAKQDAHVYALRTDRPLRELLAAIAKASSSTWKEGKDGEYILKGKTDLQGIKASEGIHGMLNRKQWDLMDDRGYLNWEDLSPQQQDAISRMQGGGGPGPGMSVMKMIDDAGRMVEIHRGSDEGGNF